jgi:four helix bundle protein
MFRFETLDIWKFAIEYCQNVFEMVDKLSQKFQYNLGEQLKRSVLSISNNIAEGSGSNSKPDFKKFLNYAIRSTFETVSMVIIIRERKCLDNESYKELYSQGELLVKRITAFRNSL